MKVTYFLLTLLTGLVFLLPSCAPVVVGTAAVGAYKGATDERSSGTLLDDSILSTKVKTKLIGDEFVKARNIDVDVINSVVYLIGVVESDSQKRMASDIAKSVDGVSRVENQLMVGQTSAGQMFDDLMLYSKIKTDMIRNPDIKSLNIDVDVHNNVITLSGITSTLAEKQSVISIARSRSGSAKIIDNIIVQN